MNQKRNLKIAFPGECKNLNPLILDIIQEVKQFLNEKGIIDQIIFDFLLFSSDCSNVTPIKNLIEQLNFCSKCLIVDNTNYISSIEQNQYSIILNFSQTLNPQLELTSITIEDELPSVQPFYLTFNFPHPDVSSAMSLFMNRFSPSEFTGEPISESILNNVIQAANRSPSAGNLQAYSVFLVLRQDLIQKISEFCSQPRVATASGLFVIVTEPSLSSIKYRSRGEKLYSIQDATIHCSHLQLALEEFGLHSRWIGAFREDDIKSLFRLQEQKVIAILIFGYPKSPPKHHSKRRNISSYLTIIK